MTCILIIDDEKPIRQSLRQILEQSGYKVLSAENGRVGVALAQEQPCALAIVDLLMPEQEGLETIRTLRAHSPAIKLIAISGGGRDVLLEFLDVARKFGAHRTFTKPFRLQEIVEAVHDLLNEE